MLSLSRAAHRNDLPAVKAALAGDWRQDRTNHYAICWAVEHKHARVEMVRLLLEHGVDATFMNDYPIRAANYCHHVEIARLLLDYGADPAYLSEYMLAQLNLSDQELRRAAKALFV